MSSTVKIGKSGRNAGWWRIRDAVRNGQAFSNSNGSFRGGPGRVSLPWGHRLPTEHHASVEAADYVIYSYATPIAWRTNGEWVTPSVKYSLTTSGHQGQAFTAVGEI